MEAFRPLFEERRKKKITPRCRRDWFLCIAEWRLFRKRVDSVALYKARRFKARRFDGAAIIKMTKRSSRVSWIYVVARARRFRRVRVYVSMI
jgi:hypothetical protein